MTKEALKDSIKYDEWGRSISNNLSSKLSLSSSKLIPGNNSERFSQWFEDGVECKILGAYDGKGWRKGKIRVKLNIEFELWEETEES